MCLCVALCPHLSALYLHQPAERRRCDSFSLQGSASPHGSGTKKQKLRLSAVLIHAPVEAFPLPVCPPRGIQKDTRKATRVTFSSRSEEEKLSEKPDCEP